MEKVTKKPNLSWLHISDLHAGMDGQAWLWPNLKERFYEDLRRLFPATQGWDLVIFSGDLTQNGTENDFKILTSVLQEIWAQFEQLGCTPKLFVVPGNHDLVRPEKDDPTAIAMQTWWQKDVVKSSFWKNSDSPYRKTVEASFSQFEQWKKSLRHIGIPLAEGKQGVIPGDCSAIISVDGGQFGLIGLNSTYLQLSGENSFGQLDVDVRQLLEVTGGEPDVWCSSNQANLLITHHPISWLHERSRSQFVEEIYTENRFVAHLFGHMHKPEVNTHASGGSGEKRIVQAASMFGLRKIGTTDVDRIHGFSVGAIDIDGDRGGITFWPRISHVVNSGARRFVADTSFDLTEQNCFTLQLAKVNINASSSNLSVEPKLEQFESPEVSDSGELSFDAIANAKYFLPTSLHHRSVRTLEQRRIKTALAEQKIAWLIADWGYGTDEFLWTSFEGEEFQKEGHIYKVTLEGHKGKEDFLNQFEIRTGFTFQNFGRLLAKAKSAVLVIENAAAIVDATQETLRWESEVIEPLSALSDYGVNIKIVLISRTRPVTLAFPIIEISPLDEAELKSYLAIHPFGGSDFLSATTVQQIYRLTGGLPGQIDSDLRTLKWMSLSQLIDSRTGILTNVDHSLNVSAGLVRAVDELRIAEDVELSRAYSLLVALNCFPFGETLSRIKYFYPDRPFHYSHIEALVDRGLIEVHTVRSTIDQVSFIEREKKILVKKTVRDYIYSITEPESRMKLLTAAASIYFGEGWIIGKAKRIKAGDLVTALGGEGGLSNPLAIVDSLLHYSLDGDDKSRLSKVLSIARILVVSLGVSHFFRNCYVASRDFLSTLRDLGDEFAGDRNLFKYYQGKSGRMINLTEEATAIFSELENASLEKGIRQRVLLNLALTTKNDPVRRRELCSEVIKLGKSTPTGMHAQSLILQMAVEDPERFKKLRALETKVRPKSPVVANNIVIFCADKAGMSLDERFNHLRSAAKSAIKSGDQYTAAVANVKIAQLAEGVNQKISGADLKSLVAAYHYLYDQRIGDQFQKCHVALWSHFEKVGDIISLLRMFRNSSFIWRLYGQDELEKKYAVQLSKFVGDMSAANILTVDHETGYYLSRVKSFET